MLKHYYNAQKTGCVNFYETLYSLEIDTIDTDINCSVSQNSLYGWVSTIKW